ncbi:hypothetical protein M0812_19213 [Anaeramoeba flamelloides]|uniref:Uncharacterized protein n=1 Tax=Anaeramoeba flamelloides TaxID=1746091 RepID=A0AAV7ZAV4_9EUKA|nr:hypothetical protein M0812_19213 [Anaeramoeba flamelloides]
MSEFETNNSENIDGTSKRGGLTMINKSENKEPKEYEKKTTNPKTKKNNKNNNNIFNIITNIKNNHKILSSIILLFVIFCYFLFTNNKPTISFHKCNNSLDRIKLGENNLMKNKIVQLFSQSIKEDLLYLKDLNVDLGDAGSNRNQIYGQHKKRSKRILFKLELLSRYVKSNGQGISVSKEVFLDNIIDSQKRIQEFCFHNKPRFKNNKLTHTLLKFKLECQERNMSDCGSLENLSNFDSNNVNQQKPKNVFISCFKLLNVFFDRVVLLSVGLTISLL